MTVEETKKLRRLCLTLSVNLRSSYTELTRMGIFDLLDLCKDLKEVSQSHGKQRIPNRRKNRRSVR